jgi:RNA polymerase sigma-70 factor (ECF subfamily)
MVEADETRATPPPSDTPNGQTDRDPFIVALEVARAGSSEAIGALLDNCRNYLLLVANSSLGPGLRTKVGASDLVQETFLEAQRLFDRFQGNNEQDLLRWLSRILENKLGNTLKRHLWAGKRDLSREASSGGDSNSFVDSQTSPSGVLMREEEVAGIQAMVSQLSDDYRRVIDLRVHQDFSFEEIGRVMSRSDEAARKLFARAIEELRTRMSMNDRPADESE